MQPDDVQTIADALAERLALHGHADAVQLLDLTRAEQNLMDALAVVRRQIAAIVRSSAAAT